MKEQNLKTLTENQLKARAKELLEDRFQLRMKKGTGQLTQTHLLQKNKKELARVKTIVREKAGFELNNKG